jgi:hypothetical protein
MGLVPKIGSKDFKFNTFSAAAKWTPTDLFWSWPVNAAVRASLTRTNVEFNQTISTVPTTFKFTDTQSALTFLVSKNFAIVEPYFGLGLVRANGDLTASGSSTVFNTTYTSSDEAQVTRTGTQWMLGAELKLLVVKFGLEYSHMLDTSRIAGKFSFYF